MEEKPSRDRAANLRKQNKKKPNEDRATALKIRTAIRTRTR